MKHELIALSEFPSMPAPWSSMDAGEAWVWGDYVAILQTKPICVAEMLSKMTGVKDIPITPVEYPYAMTVFYRKDRNPHGSSSRPILVATLEQIDYRNAAKMMGVRETEMLSSLGLAETPPVVQGLFEAGTRYNLGNYDGDLTRNSARQYFLNLVGRTLSPEGEPVKIGAISDVHGHPNTGFPAQDRKSPKGCLSVVAIALLVVVSLVSAAWLTSL